LLQARESISQLRAREFAPVTSRKGIRPLPMSDKTHMMQVAQDDRYSSLLGEPFF
jgi:hypothetical protein